MPTMGAEVWLYSFLNVNASCGGWLTPRPSCFTPRESDPGTRCTGGWVDPKAGLDMWGKSQPHWDLIPRPSSLWQVTIPATLSQPVRLNEILGLMFHERGIVCVNG
jgi:hypothetical protein